MLLPALPYPNNAVLIRTDVDDGELPQISLGTAERKLLANLPLHSEMLECTLKFLYKPNHGGSLRFWDSLPAQFRFALHRPTVNVQQVPLLSCLPVPCRHHQICNYGKLVCMRCFLYTPFFVNTSIPLQACLWGHALLQTMRHVVKVQEHAKSCKSKAT